MAEMIIRTVFVVGLGLACGAGRAFGGGPAPAFAPKVSFNVGGATIGLASGDFNGDGRLDIATGNNSQFQAKVLYGQSGGTLGGLKTIPLSDIPVRIASGDLNGDGRTDLILNDAGFSIAYGQSNNTFSPITHFSGGYKYAVGDLNNDNRQDLAVTSGSVVNIYYGQAGGTLAAPQGYAT